MPMIPLGLKETKDIDFRDPFKVSTFYLYSYFSLKLIQVERLQNFNLNCNCIKNTQK